MLVVLRPEAEQELLEAQAKPLKGFGSAGVLEVVEGAALFASIGPIRIGNMEKERQHIRQVAPEYPAFLPTASR